MMFHTLELMIYVTWKANSIRTYVGFTRALMWVVTVATDMFSSYSSSLALPPAKFFQDWFCCLDFLLCSLLSYARADTPNEPQIWLACVLHGITRDSVETGNDIKNLARLSWIWYYVYLTRDYVLKVTHPSTSLTLRPWRAIEIKYKWSPFRRRFYT